MAVAALAMLTATQGCATGSGAARPGTRAARAGTRTVPVDIKSSLVGPVVVYAEEEGEEGMDVRLGMVRGAEPVRLALPPDLVGGGLELKLIARPVGSSREAVTDEFKAEPGDRILWTLLSPIESSVATLRIELGPGR